MSLTAGVFHRCVMGRGTGRTTITCSLHFDWLWFSVGLSFLCKENFLGWWWCKDKCMMQLGILLVLLRKVMVVDSLPGFMTSVALGSCLGPQYQAQFFSCWAGLKSFYRAVGYVHDMNPCCTLRVILPYWTLLEFMAHWPCSCMAAIGCFLPYKFAWRLLEPWKRFPRENALKSDPAWVYH